MAGCGEAATTRGLVPADVDPVPEATPGSPDEPPAELRCSAELNVGQPIVRPLPGLNQALAGAHRVLAGRDRALVEGPATAAGTILAFTFDATGALVNTERGWFGTLALLRDGSPRRLDFGSGRAQRRPEGERLVDFPDPGFGWIRAVRDAGASFVWARTSPDRSAAWTSYFTPSGQGRAPPGAIASRAGLLRPLSCEDGLCFELYGHDGARLASFGGPDSGHADLDGARLLFSSGSGLVMYHLDEQPVRGVALSNQAGVCWVAVRGSAWAALCNEGQGFMRPTEARLGRGEDRRTLELEGESGRLRLHRSGMTAWTEPERVWLAHPTSDHKVEVPIAGVIDLAITDRLLAGLRRPRSDAPLELVIVDLRLGPCR